MCVCVHVCIVLMHVFFFKQLLKELSMCVYMSWLAQLTTALLGSHGYLRNLQYEGRCRPNVMHAGTYQKGTESIGEGVLSNKLLLMSCLSFH